MMDELTAPSETRTGRLTGHPDGFAFVTTERGSVYVAKNDIGGALHDDEVELRCWSAERGMQGRVERVLRRRERRLTGVVERGMFVADDVRFGRPIPCTAREGLGRATLCGGVLRDVADDGGLLEVSRYFGRRGRARTEEDAILWREELDVPIPEDALAEAARCATRPIDLAARADLRALDFVTIDPATAEDHDDALFAEPREDGGLRILVAIADVSSFVDAGGALDREARRRGASIYLPGRVAPMLPASLSSDAASLVPEVDRPAVVLELVLDRGGLVTQRALRLAMIRSGARLTYDHVGEVLRSAERAAEPARITMLRALSATAQRLRTGRRARGALAIEAAETVIETDADGEPTAMRRVEHDFWSTRAHQLVEEMMLLANETVASMLRERAIDAAFRGHAVPTPERVERVIALAEERGVSLDDAARRDPRMLRDAVGRVEDPVLREELSVALLAALASATYREQREDHYALASREYVHFTSPIRRYADLTIHRALRTLAEGEAKAPEVDVDLLNETQRRARAVQREITELHGALLVRARSGQKLEGTVVHATRQEWIVSVDDPAIQVRCRRTRDPVDVGTRITVQITNVSIPARRVEATFAGVLPTRH